MTQAHGSTGEPHTSPPPVARDASAPFVQKVLEGRNCYSEDSNYRFAIRIALMLLLCLTPFAGVLFEVKNNSEHYVSRDSFVFLAACWTIISVWIILDKGRIEEISSHPWLLLGLFNLLAALGLLFLVVIT